MRRVGDASPDDPEKSAHTRSSQNDHRKIEKVEKVKAIDEAENERTRKKFQQYMQEEEPEEDVEEKAPSPLDTRFYSASTSSASQFPDVSENALPNTPFPPPQEPLGTPSPHAEDLPQSRTFWQSADSSTQHEEKKPTYQEASDRKKEASKHSAKKQPAEFFSSDAVKEAKQKNKTGASPMQMPSSPLAYSRFMEEEERKSKSAESAAKKQKPHSLFEVEEGLASKTHSFSFEKQGKEEFAEKEKDKKKVVIELESSSFHLPAQILPLAQAAATEAASYLSPQTMPLFFQMVGMIYVANGKPGISTTEIVLNSPAFAGSRFFGTTIAIEKYDTAPDSLNIRLTGNGDAVSTFNRSIPSLYAAFQNGNFNFQIGRISAEYATESPKPVFRRRESGEGRSDSSGGDTHHERDHK